MNAEQAAPLRAVLFDHDGTLVDSEQVHAQLWGGVLAAYGHGFTMAEYKAHYAGIPTKANAADMVERYRIREHPEVLVEKKEAALAAYLASSAFPLMPGAGRAVRTLAQAGLVLGVVTGAGGNAVRTTIARHFTPSPFRTVVSGDDVARSKPAPDCYLLALRNLGVDPSQCVAIEDTETGLRAACAAGLRCVAVPGPLSAHHDFSRAAHVAADLEAAAAWILSGPERRLAQR